MGEFGTCVNIEIVKMRTIIKFIHRKVFYTGNNGHWVFLGMKKNSAGIMEVLPDVEN